MITRRRVLRAGAGGVALAAPGAAYALGIEPGLRLVVREHHVTPPGWGDRPPLTICILADLHAGEPWMPLARVHRIVAAANALKPDLHVVLGDLPAHHRFVTARVPMPDVVHALAALKAPLGRAAILGNHDWWDDPQANHISRPPAIRRLWEDARVPLLANAALRLPHGDGVWLAGTDSALAFGRHYHGADDLDLALAATAADDAPVVLMIHEPDLFTRVPDRVGLTVAGHTHGGQVRLAGWSPMVPSRYGNRFAYGLVTEGARSLVVSGGLGCSMVPVRLGVPPELTLVRISAPATPGTVA